MTKSTITRERVVALIAEHSYDSALVDALEHLLAAMDSEPDCNERNLFCSTDTARMGKVISVSAGSGATPLYRHSQPATVVPKDHQIRELVNQLRDIAIEYHGTQQLRERIARVLRAAMLSGGKS
ncbi:hypothetical protein H5855_03755 [Klebsiella pneumoniae]|nr:hypothetical protein [Klebsiella pneumoniae]